MDYIKKRNISAHMGNITDLIYAIEDLGYEVTGFQLSPHRFFLEGVAGYLVEIQGFKPYVTKAIAYTADEWQSVVAEHEFEPLEAIR